MTDPEHHNYSEKWIRIFYSFRITGGAYELSLIHILASVEELLAPAKEAAITELNVYKNAEDYRDAEKTQITKILANAKVLINNAKTAEEIAEQLSLSLIHI